ncbi:hypothetical protein LXL04_006473 [Taraxacum kok-saghyz]
MLLAIPNQTSFSNLSTTNDTLSFKALKALVITNCGISVSIPSLLKGSTESSVPTSGSLPIPTTNASAPSPGKELNFTHAENL